MSCTLNVNEREFTTDEIVESYLDGSFNDMILPTSESESVISGVPLKMQLDTANGIAYQLSQMLIIPDEDNSGKSSMSKKQFTAMMDESKKDFLDRIEEMLNATKNIEDNPTVYEMRKRLIAMKNGYSKIENMVMRILAAQKFLKFQTDSVSEFMDFLDENEFRQFDDNFSFQRDLKDTMSVRMKVFLMGITNPNVLTWDRQPTPIDMDTVFTEVKNALTGMHPNYTDYRDALVKAAEAKPWLQQVVDRLDDAERNGEGHILNEFVSAFTTHPIKMLFINYSINQEGQYEAKITESNRHTITNMILDKWQSDNMFSSAYEKNEAGDYVVNEKKLEELDSMLNSIGTAPTAENLQKVLSILGIEIHPLTAKSIATKGLLVGNNMVSLKNLFDTDFFLKAIPKQLELFSKQGDNFEKNNLFDNKNSLALFRAFAREEAKYADDVSLSSYLTGGKSIASHGFNRYSINKLRDILTNRDGIRDKLRSGSFTNNAWLSMMEDEALAKEFDIYYADVANVRKTDSDKRSRELKDLTEGEHLQLMFDNFFNQGVIVPNSDRTQKFRVVKMLYLTMSDKKNKFILNTPMEIINNMDLVDAEGNITEGAIDFLYENIFRPEYARVRYEQGVESRDMKEYNEGRKLFYIFPEINDLESIRDENGQVKDLSEDADTVAQIKEIIRNSVNSEFSLFLNDVMGEARNEMKIYLDQSYVDKVLKPNAQPGVSQNLLAMADFFLTSMVTNFRVMQNISGDPAMHFKKDIDGTWSNYSKRLAKDNGSGAEYDNSEKTPMNILALDDVKISSKFLSKVDPAYKSIDSTDAQALMSLSEYSRLLYKRGDITEQEYNTLKEIDEKDGYVPTDLLPKLVRPFKPVITADKYENGVERKVYIKFSAYPLIKNFTKGTHLEGLRKTMKKKDIHLAAFSSAIKLGNVLNPAKVFDTNRNFVELSDEQLDAATLTISRDGYKMQQEVPEKDKNLINRGTQFAKLLFNNIRNLGIDEVSELEKRYDALYAELYKRKADELQKELMEKGPNGELRLSFEKFNDIIKRELIDRQYDKGTLEYFKTERDEFNKLGYEYPFWAIPTSSKIQPVINSIIDSRIRKTKFPGKAHVLASSTGHKTTAKTLEEYRKENPKGGIIPVKGYTFGEDLAPQRFDGETVQPAELILPWNFRDAKGNLLDMTKYVKDGYIDLDKIPSELLNIQGFRIPTQGHNSMSYARVVGFFTPGADNIVVAPAEYVAQMGSDFDVDKLYTYMKFYDVGADGKIQVVNSENSKDREKVIINEILDIHEKILSYPDERIQSMISQPLSYGMFDQRLHHEIYSITSQNRSNMFISPSYQVKAYTKAASAKDAVGAYSLSSTFNSMVQRSKQGFEIRFLDIIYGPDNPFNSYALFTTSGRETVSTKLNESKTIRGSRTKADVISAIQSAAVDNENQNILEKINLNRDTMPVVSAMAHLGFHEDDIFYLLNQKIFLQDSTLVGAEIDLEDRLTKLAKDALTQSGLDASKENLATAYNKVVEIVREKMMMSRDEWKEAITSPSPYTDLAAILKTQAYKALGSKIADYQRLLNIDSSGVKKNFFETWVFETKYREMFDPDRNDPILDILVEKSDTPKEGYFEMFGKYYKPTHLSAILYFNELKLLSDIIYSDERFSLLNTTTMKYLAEEIFRNNTMKFKSKSMSVSDWLSLANDIPVIESELVKFLLSSSDLFEGNLIDTKNRLFDKDNGLTEIVKRIQELPIGKTNHFLKSIEVRVIKGVPKITFRAAKKIDEADDRMAQAVEDLYFNDRIISGTDITTKQLVEDLVRYNFLEDPFQKATNFSRFIGANILKAMGIHRDLKKFDLNDLDTVGASDNKLSFSVFTRQFIQNNPKYAPEVLVERPNQNEYEYVYTLKGQKILPGEKMIVKINNELYQSNGQYFQKIRTLQGEYDHRTPIIDAESEFDTSFMSMGTVKSTREGESAQSRRLSSSITRSNIPSLLDAIVEHSEDLGHSDLAAELRDKAVGLFENVVLSFSDKVPLARTVYTSDFNMAVFNAEAFRKMPSTSQKEKYILHEMIHTLTKKAIYAYENDPESLTTKQKNAISRLEKYRDLVRSTISRDEMKAFEQKRSLFLAGDKSVKFSKRETEILYSSSSLEEFVTGVMTSKELQAFLDSFSTSDKKKSLFKRFLELVEDILKTFGIDLTEGSLARQAYNDVMDIIAEETNPVMTKERHVVFDITPNNPLLRNCL